MTMLNVNGRPKAPYVFGNIIAEYDRPHRRFTRATLAHQEDLSLFLPAIHRYRSIGDSS